MQLPTGLFDGRDTLTISTWLRNEKGAGNYAAMFFGSASNPPTQYWLLNPKNPAGLFKSVITNGSDAGAPWGTEAGISPTNAGSGIAGPATSDAWGLYTTVIEPTRITGYLDGKKIGSVPTTRTVSQFGSNLLSFIGKSSYADDLYKGGVRDVKVWTAALDDASIAAEYYGGSTRPRCRRRSRPMPMRSLQDRALSRPIAPSRPRAATARRFPGHPTGQTRSRATER